MLAGNVDYHDYEGEIDVDSMIGEDSYAYVGICENSGYAWNPYVPEGHRCCGDDAEDLGYRSVPFTCSKCGGEWSWLSKEICDSSDNDCDGSKNENLADINKGSACDTGSYGVCAEGTRYQYCDESVDEYTWSSCEPSASPSAEKCSLLDTVDEDCDGFVCYDTQSTGDRSAHGDNSCPVAITGIDAADTAAGGESFTLGCRASVVGVNSIKASFGGLAPSSSYWRGDWQYFTFTAPADSGVYTATCGVDTSKSYSSGAPLSKQVVVDPIGCYLDADGDGVGGVWVPRDRFDGHNIGMSSMQYDDAVRLFSISDVNLPAIIVHDTCGFSFAGFEYVYLNTDCDDTDPGLFPGASELLDCVDNDCDGTVDEGFVACEPLAGACSGTLDCSGAFDSTDVCEPGCVEVPGRCSLTREYCDPDNPCHGNGNVCVGYSCESTASCAGFGPATCHEYVADGCSLSVCGSSSYKNTTDASMGGDACDDLSGCAWDCGAGVAYQEICSNGVDDDGDGLVDCQDDSCRVPATGVSDTTGLNCLGTDQTGDKVYASGDYYCGAAESDPTLGLCCPIGQKPEYEPVFGIWSCQDYDPCSPNPPYTCGFDYSSDFSNWMSSTYSGVGDNDWCVDAINKRACCNVVQFGNKEYYSDSNNVVVY